MNDTILRRDIERAISADTSYSESELSEMDVEELSFISDVLGRTDTDLDTDEISSAIANLKNDE